MSEIYLAFVFERCWNYFSNSVLQWIAFWHSSFGFTFSSIITEVKRELKKPKILSKRKNLKKWMNV